MDQQAIVEVSAGQKYRDLDPRGTRVVTVISVDDSYVLVLTEGKTRKTRIARHRFRKISPKKGFELIS